MTTERVYGLYGEPWPQHMITRAVTRHPAKFSKRLIHWIVNTGLERGWWAKGDTILDPFGGVGLGAIPATNAGLQWVGVELEAHFVQTAQGFDCMGREDAPPARLCPDCRYHAAIIEKADKRAAQIVAQAEKKGQPIDDAALDRLRRRVERSRQEIPGQSHHFDGLFEVYQDTWERLGRVMPVILQGDSRKLAEVAGKAVKASLTSPPYANRVDDSGTGPVAEQNGVYGVSTGQIGNLRLVGVGKLSGVTSPPFGSPETRDRTPVQEGSVSDFITRAYTVDRQGEQETNISALSLKHSDKKETYWDACIQVYQQVYSLLSEGGHFAVVVKGFSRNFTYIDLPKMTLDVLNDIGFQTVTVIEAMQVAEEEQQVMFQGESLAAHIPGRGHVEGRVLAPTRISHKGFFRRNYEQKFPHAPRIDSEFVLVVKK